jgi:hypothetical protein
MSEGVDDRICKSWHHHKIHELLNVANILAYIHACCMCAYNVTLTFGNSKETEEHNTIAMCSSDVVMCVANRKIYGPVFVMSCSYRYSSFVTAEDNGAKDRAMSFRILSNDIL